MNRDLKNDNNSNNEKTKQKIEELKNELLDHEKCVEFSRKICDYIKNNK